MQVHLRVGVMPPVVQSCTKSKPHRAQNRPKPNLGVDFIRPPNYLYAMLNNTENKNYPKSRPNKAQGSTRDGIKELTTTNPGPSNPNLSIDEAKGTLSTLNPLRSLNP